MRTALVRFMGLGLCVTCSGCFVTDKIPFEPEPVDPPAILNAPTSVIKIGDPFRVDKKSQAMWPMHVVVRDTDTMRELRAHFRVVEPTKPSLPPFETVIVPTGGVDPELRDLTFNVSSDTLSPGQCHKLELAVSGHFFRDVNDPTMDVSDPQFFSVVNPNFADDIDTATWWVWEGDLSLPIDPMLAATCDPKTAPKAVMP